MGSIWPACSLCTARVPPHHVGPEQSQAPIGVGESPDVHLENLYIPGYTSIIQGCSWLS